MKTLNIGLVGYGFMGRTHSNAFRKVSNFFDLPVYADPVLEMDETIFFNAGNHQQTVKLKYRDFKELVKPRVVPLTAERKKRAA